MSETTRTRRDAARRDATRHGATRRDATRRASRTGAAGDRRQGISLTEPDGPHCSAGSRHRIDALFCGTGLRGCVRPSTPRRTGQRRAAGGPRARAAAGRRRSGAHGILQLLSASKRPPSTSSWPYFFLFGLAHAFYKQSLPSTRASRASWTRCGTTSTSGAGCVTLGKRSTRCPSPTAPPPLPRQRQERRDAFGGTAACSPQPNTLIAAWRAPLREARLSGARGRERRGEARRGERAAPPAALHHGTPQSRSRRSLWSHTSVVTKAHAAWRALR